MNTQLTEYEVKQLTAQGECYIHTHPKDSLTQQSGVQVQLSQSITPVADDEHLTYKQDYVLADPGGGTLDIYLPPATKTKEYTVFTTGTGTTVVHGDGTDTINGSATRTINVDNACVRFKSDGAGKWYESSNKVSSGTGRFVGQSGTNGFAFLGTTGTTTGGGVFVGRDSAATYNTGGVEIYAGGSERLRIDSSGNVGIGGTPTTKLDVITSANSGIRVTDGAQIGIMYASAFGGIAAGTTSNHPYILLSNNSERMRIAANGVVTCNNGIKLGAGTDVLSVYDEGNWTPFLTFQVPGTSSFTYDAVNTTGKYTRIGRQVTLLFTIKLTGYTAGTASGAVVVGGFSVAGALGPQRASGVVSWGQGFVTYAPNTIYSEAGGSTLYLVANSTTAAPVFLDKNHISATTELHGSITYFTS